MARRIGFRPVMLPNGRALTLPEIGNLTYKPVVDQPESARDMMLILAGRLVQG